MGEETLGTVVLMVGTVALLDAEITTLGQSVNPKDTHVMTCIGIIMLFT